AGLVIYTAWMAQGVLTSDWPFHYSLDDQSFAPNLDWFKLQVMYPTCLWLVVTFLAVVRFLSYLDLRIRHEGWEVELLMRAEALRLGVPLAQINRLKRRRQLGITMTVWRLSMKYIRLAFAAAITATLFVAS